MHIWLFAGRYIGILVRKSEWPINTTERKRRRKTAKKHIKWNPINSMTIVMAGRRLSPLQRREVRRQILGVDASVHSATKADWSAFVGGQYSIESWTNHRKFNWPDGQTALYPKHDPSGVGSCRGLSLMAADVFGHPRYNYGFRYISLPFLSLSLSFFLLFLLSVFPSWPGVFLGEGIPPPKYGQWLGWPLFSLFSCPFSNPMNASQSSTDAPPPLGCH